MGRTRVDGPSRSAVIRDREGARPGRPCQRREPGGPQQPPGRRINPQLTAGDIDEVAELPEHVLAEDAVEPRQWMIGLLRQDDHPWDRQAARAQDQLRRSHQIECGALSDARRADRAGPRETQAPCQSWRHRAQRRARVEQESIGPSGVEADVNGHPAELVLVEREGNRTRSRETERHNEQPPGRHRHLRS